MSQVWLSLCGQLQSLQGDNQCICGDVLGYKQLFLQPEAPQKSLAPYNTKPTPAQNTGQLTEGCPLQAHSLRVLNTLF